MRHVFALFPARVGIKIPWDLPDSALNQFMPVDGDVK